LLARSITGVEFGSPLGGPLRGRGLEDGADLEQVLGVLDRRRRDDRTAVLARLDEPFGLERAQGLADRDPGDGVPLGQGDFPQLGSRSDPALDDVVANPGADIGPSRSRVGFDRTGAVVLPAPVLRLGHRHLPAAYPWAPRGFAPALNRPVAGSRVTHDSRPSSQTPARVTT